MNRKIYIPPEFITLKVQFPSDILHFSVPTNSDYEPTQYPGFDEETIPDDFDF